MSAALPALTLLAGFIAQDPYRVKSEAREGGHCQRAKRNWLIVWQYLKLPQMFKPLIFIFLVVVAPGITDAMFYFQTDVLGFSPDTLALLNVLSSVASICGVWLYRVCFRKCSLWKYLICTTVAYSLVQGSNLILVAQKTEQLTGLSATHFSETNSFLYSFVSELHLMPLMVLACQMCPSHVETTFYALVLAVINLGYLISYWIGGLLTLWLHISSTDFSNFWVLIVISSVWPLVTLLYLMILPKESRLGLRNVQQRLETDVIHKSPHACGVDENDQATNCDE